VGWYIHPKGENSMAVSGVGCKIHQYGHSPILSTNGPTNSDHIPYKPPCKMLCAARRRKTSVYRVWLQAVSLLTP